jgi:hypothetical protein
LTTKTNIYFFLSSRKLLDTHHRHMSKLPTNTAVLDYCNDVDYNCILKLKLEIQNIKTEIEEQKIVNKKQEEIINNQIQAQQEEMKIIHTEHVLCDKKRSLTKSIITTKNNYNDLLEQVNDKINTLGINLENISTTIEETVKLKESDYSASTAIVEENERTIKNVKRIQSQLMGKLAQIANITENTIFNINLSNVLSANSTQSDWVNKLAPEQLSVLLRYIYTIVQIIIKYYRMIIRYQFESDHILDPITNNKFKLFEKDYKQFKVNKTLNNTIVCLRVLIIDLLYLTDKKVLPEEKDFHLLQFLNKLLH